VCSCTIYQYLGLCQCCRSLCCNSQGDLKGAQNTGHFTVPQKNGGDGSGTVYSISMQDVHANVRSRLHCRARHEGVEHKMEHAWLVFIACR